MTLADRADGAALDQLDDAAVIVRGMNLRAHLRGDFGLDRRFGDEARFPDGVGERLFAVNVLARPKRRHGRESVRVLCRADHDGVEALVIVVKLAEVDVFLGSAMFLRRLAKALLVDVAQSDNVFAGHVRGVAGPAAAGADDSDVELLVRRPAHSSL